MLLIQNLSFQIGKKILFKNLNINIFSGAIIHIKGPNGVGKTSLIKLLAGLLIPTIGEIYINRLNILSLNKPYCIYISHNASFKTELTIFESLEFWSKVYNSFETLLAAIYYFKLEKIIDKKFYELSAGNQRKAVLAKIMICNSDLWLLDEIDTYLDKENQDLMKNLIITKANNGGIILFTSQNDYINSSLKLNIPDYLDV